MSFDILIQHSSLILALVAGICVLISVITEFTKELPFFKKIPTTLQVLALSLIICITGFFAYISYSNIHFVWYYLVAVVFASFIVALICAKGWDYFMMIINRYFKNSEVPSFKDFNSKNQD